MLFGFLIVAAPLKCEVSVFVFEGGFAVIIPDLPTKTQLTCFIMTWTEAYIDFVPSLRFLGMCILIVLAGLIWWSHSLAGADPGGGGG